MRMKSAILLVFLAIGLILLCSGFVLPGLAAEVCRRVFVVWAFCAVGGAVGWQFVSSVRQGYRQALANPAAPTEKKPAEQPRMPRTPWDRGLAIAETAIAATLFLLLLSGAETRQGSFAQACFFLAALVFIILAIMRFTLSARLGHDEAMREHWAKTGCCLACGYDLRANTTNICPECGTPIRK